MNKTILKKLGFAAEVADVESMRCPMCRRTITLLQFKDSLSVAEYNISGMCQACQDAFFIEPEEEPDWTYEEKVQMFNAGNSRFPVPPVCTALWDTKNWINYIDHKGHWG